MASKNQILAHNPDGVLWWRFWNPMTKLGGWEYMNGVIDTREAWDSIFDGRKIDKIWANNHCPEALKAMEAAREAYGTMIISEIDDDYSSCPNYNPAYEKLVLSGLAEQSWKVHELADRTCASTPYLVDMIGDKAFLCPNFVVPESWDYPKRPNKKPDECVLLLAGGIGRAKEMMSIEPTLHRFLEQPNNKIVIAGAFHHQLADYPPGKVIWSRWADVPDYTRLMRWISPDIVVSPLEHNDFNRAKSNIKWLESAMLEASFVGERWGELETSITDGKDGFLADTPEEWDSKIMALARDKDLRVKTSKAALDVVSSKWTWGGVEQHWRAALEG